MPVKSYPFIDIAVHERVRAHFAQGDAVCLFAPDLSGVLWSNGEGAALFGVPSIYDFLEMGPPTGDVAFRQLQAAARALLAVGESRRFTMRIPQGFRSLTVSASVERIALRPGEQAVLFATPRPGAALAPAEAAARMISGFDDPDTHMAVLDGDGGIVAASPGFAALGMRPQTLAHLVAAVGRDSDWLLKRPVPTGRGTLPAAIGKLSEAPALHLLFAVETILGHLDATPDFDEPLAPAAPVAPDAELAEPQRAEPKPAEIEPVARETEEAESPAPADVTSIAAPPQREPEVEAQLDDSFEPDVATEDAIATTGDEAPLLDAAHDLSDEEQAVFEWSEPDEAASDALADDAEAPAASADLTAEPAAEETLSDVASPAVEETAATPEADMPVAEEQLLVEDEPATSEPVENDRAESEPVDQETPPLPAAAAVAPSAPEARPVPPVADGVEAGFRFDPAMRAVRFVWKIGADGRFSEISPDFALAVGPRAADVIGQSFEELAARFGLDPDETITTLLRRRDTWSGKTVFWPVEGEALRVPVDLAALPTYSRNRDFDGFRGFGIVRISDLVKTDTVLLGPEPQSANIEEEPATASTTPAEPETVDAPDVSDPQTTAEEDPFRGERPALKLVETPSRRATDKVVSIEELRNGTPETLSRAEQAAFREIARQLGTVFGKRTTPPVSTEDETDLPADELLDAAEGASTPEPASLEDSLPAEVVADEAEASEDTIPDLSAAEDETPAASSAEQVAPQAADDQHGETAEGDPAEATDVPSAEPEASSLSVATPAEDDEIVLVAPAAGEAEPDEGEAVSDEPAEPASAEPPLPDEPEAPDTIFDLHSDQSREGATLNVATLDRMPMALLVHSGDELYHANSEFLKLTGYTTLEELRVEGGLDALFVGEDEGLLDTPDGAVMMIRNDGRLVPVQARLQSIRFEDRGAALMMSLAVVAREPASAGPAVTLSLVPPARPPVVEEPEAPPAAEPDADRAAMEESLAEAEMRASALAQEAEELRSILETATDGVVVIGAEGEIRSLNRSASALFNYDDSEVRTKPFAMLFAHESQRAVMDYLAGLSGHGVASVLNDGREVIGREAGGGFIPLFMTMGRLSSSNGYCAVIRDITQWKRSEEELRAAKRAAETANAHKTEFLARVSHEIRTPLNAIIGFSDMMASEHFGPIGNARYVEYAGDIGRSGRHVLDIVNDLLDISKIEAGEMELDFAEVDMNEAVSEAVALVQPQANMQRVIIRTSLPGTVPAVVADQRSIKQIALNILSNAIRFTPSGGQIVVSTAYEPNGSVILRIRDTGIGMTRSELDQAMKPFRQVTTGARKRGDGTGLGLPLTKAMTEANRATFSIHSAPNEGTLVEVAFPSQRVLAD
ncbi:ATP-binding protein [Rhizobium sp. YIM 134829]|uniref:ATP-binding protein n=1 Tax=Rhizobium sp. YIM 134829 TaxID=3390453 RepID=UPI00397B8902